MMTLKEKRFDAVALGELLIDFTQNGVSDSGNLLMEANPGGAPCNVLAMLCKFGKKTAFIGKVGDDMFGKILKETLAKLNINSENLIIDKDFPTTLAFIRTLPGGERDFSFYRNPGADMMLREDEVSKDLIASSRLFHFGTLSMTGEEVSHATKKAVYAAKEAGCIITFDPNVRLPLWNDKEDIKAAMEFGFSQCDVLKISDNEIEFFTGTSNYHDGINQIRRLYPNIKLVFATLGPKGSMAFYNDLIVEKKAFIRNDTIEATGAGDSFFGIAINFILDIGLENLNEDFLKKILIYANAGASIITTRKGALCAMPTPDEIEKFLSSAGEC